MLLHQGPVGPKIESLRSRAKDLRCWIFFFRLSNATLPPVKQNVRESYLRIMLNFDHILGSVW